MRVLIIKKSLLIITVVLVFTGLVMLLGYYRVISTSNIVTLNKVIILDAGHGGIDGGAVSRSGVKESLINLKIALKLRSLLEQSGAIVFLTRDEDMGLYSDSGTIRNKKNEDLRNRRELIESSEADLFVSIHLNSFPQSQYYGAQTFYPPNGEESKEVAELIQEELIRVLNNGNNRESKVKNDVYLLKNSSIPTVLVECGFLSNPYEERVLQENKYQEKLAWSIYIGILRYFHESSDKVFSK